VLALAEAGLLGLGLVDPLDEPGRRCRRSAGRCRRGYQNTYRDALFFEQYAIGLGCSIRSEPGFLRVALAYHRVGRLPPSMIKLYLNATTRGVGYGLPPTLPSLEAYLAMMEGRTCLVGVSDGRRRWAAASPGWRWSAAATCQVGLEVYGGPGTPANVELVSRPSKWRSKPAPVATSAQAREILGVK
jgi:hypothetical protein